MRYFHVPLCQISGNRMNISGREKHHLVNVLRLHLGDEITVLDGSGGIYEVVLISCEADAAVGEIKNYRQVQPPEVKLALFVGLPKADKMDMIVQKATELGAHRIVPVLCQRIVPHLSAERAQKRVVRWRQIAVEASKQSRRPFFPLISNVMRFHEALEECQMTLKLIFVALPSAAPEKLKKVLELNPRVNELSVLIGPEGGFTGDEISLALSAGAVPVSLGDNILRTETAAIAAVAIILYERNAARNRYEVLPDHTQNKVS